MRRGITCDSTRKVQHLQEPRRWRAAPRAARARFLDVFGHELGHEADGGEGQRQEAGERPEAEHGHQKDRDDDLVERARERDEAAAEQVDPAGREVARRADATGIDSSTPTRWTVTVIVRLS
jgi:hypothetical protein